MSRASSSLAAVLPWRNSSISIVMRVAASSDIVKLSRSQAVARQYTGQPSLT